MTVQLLPFELSSLPGGLAVLFSLVLIQGSVTSFVEMFNAVGNGQLLVIHTPVVQSPNERSFSSMLLVSSVFGYSED